MNWVFEIAKTNNEMMSSVALGKFIQTGTFDSHARFETWFCHTGSTNTSSLWFVDTFDKSQTSIQHNYPYHFMNMKENILFLRNEWTTTGEVDKTDRTALGKCIHLYDVTQGNKETKRFWQKIVFVKGKKNR